MEVLYQNTWFWIACAVFAGALLGYLIIRPLLKRLAKKLLRKDLPYLSRLVRTIASVSPILGAIILLNFLGFYPLGLDIKDKFQTTLTVLNIVFVTYLFAEFLVFLYDKYSDRNTSTKVSSLFHIIIRLTVYFAGIFVMSAVLDYDIQAMLTALGVGGLAIALALQDTLSNLFAGMHILASRQLRPGDYIKIKDSVEGYVYDINWRNTKIKTLLENVIIVPNSKISTTITTNYFTLQKNLYFHVEVGVHYDSDLEVVERVTLEVAQEVLDQHANVPKDFIPKVRYYEFSDSSINMKVWMATDLYENQYKIRHQFIKSLQARYRKEGIIIPYPIRSVYMESND